MRIAAWALIVLSGAACAWFVAVSTMLIVPGSDHSLLGDPYYEVAAARGALLPAFLALANGIAVLPVHRKRRPGALWIVLFAGLLALGAALWQYLALHALDELAQRVPDHTDQFAVVERGRAWLRALLAWAALGFTITGWLAWRVNQRITFNLDRG